MRTKSYISILAIITAIGFYPLESFGFGEGDCVECHTKESPGIIGQWMDSKHADAEISCIDCHAAEVEDVDAFEHYGENIAVIVSPLDCAECHET